MKVLVTGGGGFLGRAVVNKLLARGDQVRSLARGRYPELEAAGVETFRGDLTDRGQVRRAASGCDAVVHTAAKAGVWGRYDDYFAVNVRGVQNVIAACRAENVGRLVYTSTPSVVHGGDSVSGVDESAPYAEKFITHYPRTKAEAERLVLAADGPDLAAAALRPHLIWGPGDPHFIPRLLDRARRGRLAKLKGGPYLVDTVYIDNAADAHLLALDRLTPGGGPPGGRPYFISQGEPIDVGRMIDLLLAAAGLPPVQKEVSPRLAYAAGALLEGAYKLLRRPQEPPMTRFVAAQMSTSHWFDIGAARRDLGYEPAVSLAEGMRRLADHLRAREESAY